jgi:hypothetical protein
LLEEGLNACMRASQSFVICLALLILLSMSPSNAHAQSQITLGNATTALNGPWKFRTGDNLAWAQPDFDDSSWATMDLTPPPGSFDPILGSSGYLPGWTARGYKGYSGYAWYRLKTNVEVEQTRLAIKLPRNLLVARRLESCAIEITFARTNNKPPNDTFCVI